MSRTQDLAEEAERLGASAVRLDRMGLLDAATLVRLSLALVGDAFFEAPAEDRRCVVCLSTDTRHDTVLGLDFCSACGGQAQGDS